LEPTVVLVVVVLVVQHLHRSVVVVAVWVS
jgi:hypothetical protein